MNQGAEVNMSFRRNALTFSPKYENAAIPKMSQIEAEKLLMEIQEKRESFIDEIAKLEVRAGRIETRCGLVDDSQHVELYDGTLGVTKVFVKKHSPPVGQLQWLDDLSTRFSGSQDSPGDVSGTRWGSGALISDDLFITAGHCFDQEGAGWKRPQ